MYSALCDLFQTYRSQKSMMTERWWLTPCISDIVLVPGAPPQIPYEKSDPAHRTIYSWFFSWYCLDGDCTALRSSATMCAAIGAAICYWVKICLNPDPPISDAPSCVTKYDPARLALELDQKTCSWTPTNDKWSDLCLKKPSPSSSEDNFLYGII